MRNAYQDDERDRAYAEAVKGEWEDVRAYPEWICSPCGNKHGNGMPEGHLATWHAGVCGICGAKTGVTEPRDFRGLKPTWRMK